MSNTSEVRIRPATADDLPRVLQMREQSFATGKLGEIFGAFDLCHFAYIFATAVAKDRTDEVWLFVAEDGGKTVGVSFGVASPVWLSPTATAATEMFVWVEPDARGRGVGAKLVEAVESWARERGCSLVTLFSYPGLEPAAMTAIATKRGYAPAETAFIRRV